MAENDLRARADERYEQALKAAGLRDPKDFYRRQLRALRERDPDAYRRALGYFNERLIPAVASEDSDPLAEWMEYGRVLATLFAPGRTVQIDVSGLARDYARPVPTDALVLHLPDETNQRAIVVGLPPRLSRAQRAAHDLLARPPQGEP